MKRDVEEHTANIVSGKMRELGRLITTTEKQNGITSVRDCIRPCNFNITFSCLKELTGCNEEDIQYKNPALNLGYAAKKCSQILRSEGPIESNSEKDGRTFIELYEGNWADTICCNAPLQGRYKPLSRRSPAIKSETVPQCKKQ